MAQPGMLAVFLLLLLLTQGLPALQSERCSVQEDPRVTDLLMRMLQSFNTADTPNPSILLALRLASTHNLEVERAMVQRLKEDAVHRVQNNLEFTSGTVALYVMALQASCENPRTVSAHDSTIDLVQLLKDKYELEWKTVETKKRLLTNYFQVGLDILALCLQNVSMTLGNVLPVSCPKMHYGYGEHHSVDTASVLALGLACVANRTDLPSIKKPWSIRKTLVCLVRKILSGKQANGVIGNIYSTGLAMQALSVTQDYYDSSRWNCTQTLPAVLDAINKGDFSNPMAASQIMPSLQGRTYLDARVLQCSADPDNLPIISTSPSPTDSNPCNISVSYKVIDGVSHTFDNSITVDVPEGSTFLVVMEAAQSQNPQDFSFTTKRSSWGLSVDSINGLAASTIDKTYWQLQSGSTPLDRGVGDYQPSAGEQLVSRFTTY